MVWCQITVATRERAAGKVGGEYKYRLELVESRMKMVFDIGSCS